MRAGKKWPKGQGESRYGLTSGNNEITSLNMSCLGNKWKQITSLLYFQLCYELWIHWQCGMLNIYSEGFKVNNNHTHTHTHARTHTHTFQNFHIRCFTCFKMFHKFSEIFITLFYCLLNCFHMLVRAVEALIARNVLKSLTLFTAKKSYKLKST